MMDDSAGHNLRAIIKLNNTKYHKVLKFNTITYFFKQILNLIYIFIKKISIFILVLSALLWAPCSIINNSRDVSCGLLKIEMSGNAK